MRNFIRAIGRLFRREEQQVPVIETADGLSVLSNDRLSFPILDGTRFRGSRADVASIECRDTDEGPVFVAFVWGKERPISENVFNGLREVFTAQGAQAQ